MIRSPDTVSGFHRSVSPAASHRLTGAVAATLTLGALSLGLIVTLTVLSIKASIAMPCPV